MQRSIHPLASMLLIIVASSLWLYFLMRLSSNKKNKNLSTPTLFDSSEIKGVLASKSFKQGLETIEVKPHPKRFTFRPKINVAGNLFHAQTSIGDSIIKPAFSPVITVISGKEQYQYQFD